MLPKLPLAAAGILAVIRAAGGEGYLVGGALRDLMRGETPQDWDFATTLSSQQILAAFAGARLIGGHCGTVQVPFGSTTCEVTPCRSEGPYSDARHPDTVAFHQNILLDLARRDFTVNAMAYDGEVLIDPFGGQRDLAARRLACVGKAADRFAEDPLRILRMFRFAATLDFAPEWETLNAATAAMPTIAMLSRERVRAEVEQILFSARPGTLATLVAKGGLESCGLAGTVLLASLTDVPNTPLCRWWTFLALCNATARRVGDALGFSQRFIADLEECGHLYAQGPAQDKRQLKQKLRNSRLDYAELSASFTAVSPVFAGEPVLFAAVQAGREPYRRAHLAISGEDLLRQNEQLSGDRCGEILDALLDAVIQHPELNEPPALLSLARKIQQNGPLQL